MNRTVLILSPHFPPSTMVGGHRARHLARRLPAHGWRPIVVRAHERHYAEPGDPALAALVAPDLEQVRTGAFSARLSRLVGIGDIGLRAWPHFRGAITKLVAKERPSVVFITGSPFYPMLLARGIRGRFALPVVLDFQDPWVSAHGATQPFGSKAWLAHRLAVALEPIAVRNAAFVTSVSDLQNRDMADRYPWLDRERMAAIPIGGDPDDFSALRGRELADCDVQLDPGVFNINYIGSYWPRVAPSLRQLFAAMAQFRNQSPDLASRIRLNFVGTNPVPDADGGPFVVAIAEAAGVGDLVREFPRRLPYLEALKLMVNSDALLLVGSDEPHYTASKIYPALLSGRPWLSLFHERSSAHQVLVAAGGGRAIGFADAVHLANATPALVEGLRDLATSSTALGEARPDAVRPYTAHAIAGRFADIFKAVAKQ